MGLEAVRLSMKSRGLMFISYYKKDEDRMIKVDETIIKCKRKDLENSITETKVPVEYVTARPERFQLNTLYILRMPPGRPDYIYLHAIKD
jgi:hypothetical protein